MSLPAPVTAVLALVMLAALAGCAALVDTRADRREGEWNAAFPPLGRFLSVEGHRVHLIEAGRARGTAPSIVLIHGANGNLRDFTFDLVGRLESDFHVVALDRPGLGHSDSLGEADSDPRVQARLLRAAVAQLGVQRPIVLGHSYGGAVAMAWALEAPAQTEALVIIAGATQPWEGSLSFWYGLNNSFLGRPARAMVAAFAPERIVAVAFDNVFAPDPVPPGYDEYFGAGLALRRDTQATNNRQVNALLEYLTLMQPGYPALRLPIELLHGDGDTTVGLEIHSRRLAREVDSARLTVIPGAGHMLHHAHAEAVLAAIARAQQRARSGS